MKPIYLDTNASSPPIIQAKTALINSINNIGNPSSPHCLGRLQKTRLDSARLIIAKSLDTNEKNIVFTSGASEANRFLVESILSISKKNNQKLNVVTTPFEHPSLEKPLTHAAKLNQIKLAILKLKNEKIILDNKLLYKADVVFATQAHNETGIIIDWTNIIKNCKKNTILICDASQGFSKITLITSRIDAIVISGHKIGAFPGIGALMLSNNAKQFNAKWLGGGQERGLRPGTEALGLIEAFAAASKIIEIQRKQYQNISKLRDMMENNLLKIWPNSKILGKKEARLPNTTAFLINNMNGEALRIAIDTQKICVGFGSACSGLSPEPSPALIAMNLTPKQVKSTIRISLHPKTTKQEILDAIMRLKKIKIKTIK
jgi:cysteine desulfurase